MSAKCNGVRSQFATFNFLFGVALGKKVLTPADNLSKSLQAEALSASEGQAIAQSTVNALLKLRNEEKFAEFWKDVLTIQEANDVSVPQLPRKRKSLRGVRKPQVNHTFLCQSRTTTARYISLPLTLLYKLFSRDLIKTATGSTSSWRNSSSRVAEVNPLLLSCRMSKPCTRMI